MYKTVTLTFLYLGKRQKESILPLFSALPWRRLDGHEQKGKKEAASSGRAKKIYPISKRPNKNKVESNS